MTCCLQMKVEDDRIIAELTREVSGLRKKVRDLEEEAYKRSRWLREAKAAAGYDDDVSFDVVWAAALAALKTTRT